MAFWEWEGTLYSVSKHGDRFHVVKFDDDFNVLKVHYVTRRKNRYMNCDCPEKDKPMCLHRRCILIFEEKGRVNRGWFLDWHDYSWEPPLTWPISQAERRIRMKDYVVDR